MTQQFLILGIYPRAIKDHMSLHKKNLYANVRVTFLINKQKVEITQIFINWWVDEYNLAYIHAVEYYLSLERDEVMIHA